MTEPLQKPKSTAGKAIRKKAIRRSYICPGAGFALVGNRTLAIVAFSIASCNIPTWIWLSRQPTTASLWTFLVFLGATTVFGLAEQFKVKRSKIQKAAPQFLTKGFVPTVCLLDVSAIAVCVLLITSYGSLVLAGSRMVPTIEKGEQLVYFKRVDWQRVKPGALIVFKNPDDSDWDKPGSYVVSRILVGPGDTIAIKNNKYVVNGETGPPIRLEGDSGNVIRVPSAPDTITVPDDSYFVVQDSPKGGYDSRMFSWIPKENIVTAHLWYLRPRRGILSAVK